MGGSKKMSLSYIIDKVFCEDGNLCFQMRGNKPISKIHARQSHEKNKFAPNLEQLICKTFDTIKIGDAYCIPINFFSKFRCVSPINDILLYTIDEKGEYVQLQTSQNCTIVENDVYLISLKSTADNHVQISLEINYPQIICSAIYNVSDEILLDIETKEFDVEIAVKQRYDINSSCGKVTAIFSLDSYSTVTMPLSIFDNNLLFFSCDFYARVNLAELNIKVDVPLYYSKSSDIKINRGWRTVKLYQNKKGHLSAYTSAVVFPKYIAIKQNENGFMQMDDVDTVFLLDNKNEIKAEFQKENLSNILNYKEIKTYTLYERVRNCLYKLCVDRDYDQTIKNWDREYLFKGNQTSFTLRIKKRIDPIKIATLGSCYIRIPFQEKYNKDWRDYFDIVLNCFQPSVFAMASDPVTKLTPNELIVNSDSRVENNVKRDFEKTFFEEIKNSRAQYLLLDFYADALCSARKFDDGTYVGNKLSFFPSGRREEVAIYKEKVMSITASLEPDDLDYIAEWKISCDKFCKAIKEIGYSDKIILMKGIFNLEFIDYENKKFYDLSNKKLLTGCWVNKDYCVEKTYLWDQMNEYFISQLPDTKIIDLSRYNFYANFNFKTNNVKMPGPHHFEDNFYRAFFAELCKQILF